MSHGDAFSLWRPFYETRPNRPALRFISDDDRVTSWTWDAWQQKARAYAGALTRLGIGRESRVACVLSNTPNACALVLGTWMCGAALVSMPTRARGMSEGFYALGLQRIIAQSRPDVVLDVPCRVVQESSRRSPIVFCNTAQLRLGSFDTPQFPRDGDATLIQYSSGSTGDPRGCVLSAKSIARQLEMLAAALELDWTRDVKVDWIPLSHDMGFFLGFLVTAYWTGVQQVVTPPQRFARRPWTWFDDCAHFKATMTSAPNFALHLATRAERMLGSKSVPMRALVLGGETNRAETINSACKALTAARLPPRAVVPAYGCAEAALAVTVTKPGSGIQTLTVENAALEAGFVVPATRNASHESNSIKVLVSAGGPVAGVELDIVGSSDLGEVRVRSPSLADGYLGRPDMTHNKFTACGLATGDIGFVHDGQLYIRGRVDDLLVVNGRNVFALDVETAFAALGLSVGGACAVVSLPEDGRFVAVAEAPRATADLTLAASQMRDAARNVAGLPLSECVFLPPKSFPMTPSGKIQRFRCQEIAVEGALGARRVPLRDGSNTP